MATALATEGGEVTDELVEHYALRAKAGAGVVIVEHTYVTPDGQASPRQLSIIDDTHVRSLARLARAVKDAGALAGIQLNHAGGVSSRRVTGLEPVAPSEGTHPRTGETVKAIDEAGIVRMKLAFVTAALRAKEAGFDFVELHGAHGFLLCQFMSPLMNRRTDRYGGDLERRAALPLEVVVEVRKAIGERMPLFYRLGADDMTPGGLSIDDAEAVSPLLVEAGVDVLDISGGLGGSRPPGLASQGYFLPWAERIRTKVGVPVVCTGGFTDPLAADDAIRAGRTDLVGVGRAQLADAEWAVKARMALIKERRAEA
jgi:2,4-dienoyl-CoA reductase-like NADH-dependent reductase (Old Yellow Enzyme family)